MRASQINLQPLVPPILQTCNNLWLCELWFRARPLFIITFWQNLKFIFYLHICSYSSCTFFCDHWWNTLASWSCIYFAKNESCNSAAEEIGTTFWQFVTLCHDHLEDVATMATAKIVTLNHNCHTFAIIHLLSSKHPLDASEFWIYAILCD